MASNPRAFVSFDFDNNSNDRMLFAGQAMSTSPTPFTVEDWSSKTSLPQSEWEAQIKAKIAKTNMLIVLVGRGVYSKNGRTSFTAMVALPHGTDFFNIERVSQPGRPKDSGDTAYIYTGGALAPYWIDAGFMRGANSLPGWGMVIIHAEPNPNFNKIGANGQLDGRRMLHITSLPKDQTPQNRLFLGGIVRMTFTMPSSASAAATAVLKVEAGAGGAMRYCAPTQSASTWTEVKQVSMEQIAMPAKRFKGKKANNNSTKMVTSIAQAIGGEHPDRTGTLGLRQTNSFVKGTAWSDVKVDGSDFDTDAVDRAGSYPFDRRYISYQTTNQWFNEQIIHLKTKP